MIQAILFAALAGVMIPLGGVLARVERIGPDWLEQEFRHGVIAFGGGALLAAVSFVLVPQGAEALPAWGALLALGLGGVAFAALDSRIARSGGSLGQLVAMLADFIPEAIALGAMFATGAPTAPLLAALIALQNLPEGFNAYRELVAAGRAPRRVLTVFCALACLGPLAAFAGHVFLVGLAIVQGALMLFAAGGILYLIFQDIAPAAPLNRAFLPPLGAVFGFMLGLAGHLLLG